MSPRQQAASPANPRLDADRTGPLVLIDADNTLWDTDGVFAEAQLELLGAVEQASNLVEPAGDRLQFVRSFDQELAARHHLGLRYPPRLLVDALSLALRGVVLDEAVRRAWNNGAGSGLNRDLVARLEAKFIKDIAKQPKLLDGVPEGLCNLVESGATSVILTEGSRKRVMRTIEHHGLGGFIDRVFEAPKTARMFSRVRGLARDGQSIYMIGDQLTRDIRPATAAGLKAIYVPGAFQPKWEAQAGNVATFQAATFDAAVSLLIQLEEETRPPQLASGKPSHLRVRNRTQS